jgi:uncharacterized protein
MAQQRSEELPGLPTDYYVPDFELLMGPTQKKLSPVAKGDVLEVKVVLDIDNMASADVTINNWDADRFEFKYSDTGTFDLENQVHVKLGYADRLKSMLRGKVSAISPRFPEAGPPTMQVHVADAMLDLRDAKQPEGQEKRYEQVYDWEIAQRIAERNKLKSEVTRRGPWHPLVVQPNESDLVFLKKRAEAIDFDVFVFTDPDTGDETLHFVDPTDGRGGKPITVYKLVWGESLIEFSPTMTQSRQVAAVTVRGWDPVTKQPISATATHKDLPQAPGGAKSGPELAAERKGGRQKQEEVVDRPVYSQEEAFELAKSLLIKRSYQFLQGSGRIIGLPDLRPGDNLDLAGLGRFSGTYHVRKVEHSWGSSGYTTQFEVRRPHDPGPSRKGAA